MCVCVCVCVGGGGVHNTDGNFTVLVQSATETPDGFWNEIMS
jgi:hypothetical protein